MKTRISLLALCVVLTAGVAQATPITFSLTSSLLSALPGQTVTFSGTITELGGSTFINGDSTSVAGGISVNDTLFFLNVPGHLTSGDTLTVDLFTVFVPLGLASGLYSGSFTILGGGNPSAVGSLATQAFSVSVGAAPSPVPEPATASLLILGLALGAAQVSRNRRASR